MPLVVIQLIALFLLLLVTGVFWGNWLSLSRSMEAFSVTELIHVARILVQNLALPMRIISPGCIAFMALSTWLYPQKESINFFCSIGAIVLILLALLITILIEVPINNQIINWTASTAPPDWETIRNRWQFFNGIRVITSLASFALFAITIY